ncbi:MAG TPA: MarR family transcriptional regulator [Jiangellales bacterium]|nr:MarR family transcriptional regulator [Jiangellales bacterium]
MGAALIRAARTHRAVAAALLAPYGLHPGQEFLLTALWERSPRSPSELAATCAVEPPTVTRMVGRLETAGLVRRTPDPGDRRAVLVELTRAGEGLRGKVRESWGELERRSTARLGPEERATLVRLLGAVTAGLGTPDDG